MAFKHIGLDILSGNIPPKKYTKNMLKVTKIYCI